MCTPFTQQFNTTTSMGRLTLNMLLSFAQFEREVTGERIRDKIAASKRKGMWMGGTVPLGYEVKDRKLVPQLLTDGPQARSPDAIPDKMEAISLVLSVQASLRRAGKEIAMVIGADPAKASVADPAMMRLILRARVMWEKVRRGEVAGLGELATHERISGSYASRLIRLAFLAPDILTSIMSGRHPAGLSAAGLLQECRRGLPLDWQHQRDALGFH